MQSIRLKFAWLLLIPVAGGLGGVAWYFSTGAADDAGVLSPEAAAADIVIAPSVAPSDLVTVPLGVENVPDIAQGTDVESEIRGNCPWPPTPGTWRTLDERCQSAVAEYGANEHWRFVFAKDPLETRRAVVDALDDPQCHVAEDELRPDLYEACAAEAMVRLGELQESCVYFLHWDPEDVYEQARKGISRIAAEAASQDQYYDRVEVQQISDAYVLWKFHSCRSAENALEWVDALPSPADPLGPGERDSARRGGLPYTQRLDLREAARRLGYPYSAEELENLAYMKELGHIRIDDPGIELEDRRAAPPPGVYRQYRSSTG